MSVPPSNQPPHESGAPESQHAKDESRRGLTRRQMITAIGFGGLATGAVGLAGGMALERHRDDGTPSWDTAVDFRGEHQPGIITPAQQQMIAIAFDMTASRQKDLIDLLEKWSIAAERLMDGDPVNTPKVRDDVPPDDTGEAMDLGPASLTVTFAFGASLFEHPEDGDRFGIAHRMPSLLRDGIPRMAAEKIDEDRSHGDLLIQICAEDPMVVLHAAHQFKRIAFGLATVRWMQLGYGRTSSTSKDQKTPRNLFGFKDGTANIKAEEPQEELNEHLWIQPDDEAGDWAAGGSYFAFRKILQMMEVWDELILSEQENIVGRDKLEGAPLSGGEEFTEPDFNNPAIDENSHVRLMHPDNNNGRRMLRRGYNYTEGIDYLGRLNAGLFFIAYVRNPQTNFVPILAKMRTDLMTEYLQHIATGLYIVPPGMRDGDTYVGQTLFS